MKKIAKIGIGVILLVLGIFLLLSSQYSKKQKAVHTKAATRIACSVGEGFMRAEESDNSTQRTIAQSAFEDYLSYIKNNNVSPVSTSDMMATECPEFKESFDNNFM